MKQYFVYILCCSDGSYYTGITHNLDLRIRQHESGSDSKSYTYTRRPVKLVFMETFSNPLHAISAEKQIKGWSRKKKEALINGNMELLRILAECKNQSHYRNFK